MMSRTRDDVTVATVHRMRVSQSLSLCSQIKEGPHALLQ